MRYFENIYQVILGKRLISTVSEFEVHEKGSFTLSYPLSPPRADWRRNGDNTPARQFGIESLRRSPSAVSVSSEPHFVLHERS